MNIIHLSVMLKLPLSQASNQGNARCFIHRRSATDYNFESYNIRKGYRSNRPLFDLLSCSEAAFSILSRSCKPSKWIGLTVICKTASRALMDLTKAETSTCSSTELFKS